MGRDAYFMTGLYLTGLYFLSLPVIVTDANGITILRGTGLKPDPPRTGVHAADVACRDAINQRRRAAGRLYAILIAATQVTFARAARIDVTANRGEYRS